MLAREKKELVGYLQKETKRLKDAIQKAEEKSQFGKAEHHQRSLDAYEKFLENIYSDRKKPFLFLAAVMLAILTSLSSTQAAATKEKASEFLSGKVFLVELAEKIRGVSTSCRLAFKGGKIRFSPISEAYSSFAKFPAAFYYGMVDSSQGGMILFSAQSKNSSGETMLWIGSAEGSIIKGTIIWSDGKKRYKVYSFSGKLKEANFTEGKF